MRIGFDNYSKIAFSPWYRITDCCRNERQAKQLLKLCSHLECRQFVMLNFPRRLELGS